MSKNKELLEFENINSNIIKKLGVQALADRPNAAGKYGNAGMSAAQLKAWFDQLAEFLANKINTIQDTFSSEDIARYIRLTLDEYDVEHLQDLVDAVLDGSFAEKLLMVLPTQTDTERVTLQSAIFKINKNIADQIASVRKQITDLGYGYTDADVRFIEDGGEVGADVEAVDDNGSRVLIFTFRNFGKGAFEAALDFPIVGGTSKNSVVQQIDGDVENKAITENSVALGEGNIAGAKGYYFTEIFYGKASINPQIKVSAVQPKDMGLYISPEVLSSNSTFEAPNYEIGDVFSLICNDHFALFGTITDIDHDVISFKGDIEVFKSGLTNMVSNGVAEIVSDHYINRVPNYDDYTLCVPTKPLDGIVEVCKNTLASGCGNIAAGEEGTALGAGTKVVGAYGHTSGLDTLAGYAASAEGSGSQAPAKYSHAQNMNTKATGLASHAEGLGTTSSGQFSHSEGTSAIAKGDASHAEGRSTQSLANGTHSEGGYTTAQGSFSHAEGASTLAKGIASHAGGYHTIASVDYQTAIGMYNKQNPNALFVVGNGTSEDARTNAFEVLKDGKVTFGKASYGAEDLEAGVSPLPTGALYFVYE